MCVCVRERERERERERMCVFVCVGACSWGLGFVRVRVSVCVRVCVRACVCRGCVGLFAVHFVSAIVVYIHTSSIINVPDSTKATHPNSQLKQQQTTQKTSK